ncbi:MAG: DUF6440 family protein [Clostridiaceae bacterium]|nr:DUF6440 family protein [Clostridiaceae bacterium]
MKRFFGVAVCLSMFILGACSAVVANAENEQTNPIKIWLQNQVWYTNYSNCMTSWNIVDEETGVNYIVVSYNGLSITPRLNSDGSLYISR